MRITNNTPDVQPTHEYRVYMSGDNWEVYAYDLSDGSTEWDATFKNNAEAVRHAIALNRQHDVNQRASQSPVFNIEVSEFELTVLADLAYQVDGPVSHPVTQVVTELRNIAPVDLPDTGLFDNASRVQVAQQERG